MVNVSTTIRMLRRNQNVRLSKLQLIKIARALKIKGLLVGGYIMIEVLSSTGQTLLSFITNENFFDRLEDLTGLFDPSLEIANVSDGITYLTAIPSETAVVSYHINKGNNRGGFFPYYNMTNMDMKRFGIFSEEQYNIGMFDPKDKDYTATKEEEVMREMIMDNCLMHSLKQSKKFKHYQLDVVREDIITDKVSAHKLKDIGQKLQCDIKVKNIATNSETLHHKKIRINGKLIPVEINDRVILNLFHNHYFLNEKFDCSMKAVKEYANREEECKEPDLTLGYRDIPSTTDIKKYLKYVFSFEKKEPKKFEKFFKVIDYDGCANYHIYRARLDLSNNYLIGGSISLGVGDDFKEMFFKEPRTSHSISMGFDFETDPTFTPHRAYLVSFKPEHHSPKSLCLYKHGKDFIEVFLDSVVKYAERRKVKIVKMYAHNLAYDFQFVSKFGYNISHIGTARSVFSSKMKYKGITLHYIDTYKMISAPLHKFSSMFNLDIDKEVMPYELYSGKYIETEKSMPLELVERYFEHKKQVGNQSDYGKFLTNVKKLNLLVGKGHFDHHAYSIFYCERDVEVMMQGMVEFSKHIKIIGDGLDMYSYLTISSVAKAIAMKYGCFDDTFAVRGNVYKFMEKTVLGGRTMIANNEKSFIENRKLADLDANGLYLSSMNELGKMGGLLKGKPLRIPSEDLENWKKFDGVFLEVYVTEVGQEFPFPLYAFRDGVLNWTNELIGKSIYVNRIQLEDMIEFHKIKFKVVRGLCYKDGRNPKILEYTDELHNKRKEYKKVKNPIQKTYKDIGNGLYGKTIERPHHTDMMIFNNKKDFEKKIASNYYRVKSGVTNEEFDFFSLELIKEVNSHYNLVHIGSEILSMSKRIMNRVMCLCHLNDIDVFYSDTDSMPMDYDKLDLLCKLYREKYHTNLLDDGDLGKFANDFDFPSDEPIYAVNGIYLAKKCYYNKVRTIVNGEEIFHGHYRMKGYPLDAITELAGHHNLTVEELYMSLLNGTYYEVYISKLIDRPFFETIKGKFVTRFDYKKSLGFPKSYKHTNGHETTQVKVENREKKIPYIKFNGDTITLFKYKEEEKKRKKN